MRPERDRFAQHAPRLHAGRLDPRHPQPHQGRLALPVAAQPGGDVAAGQRELGGADVPEGDPAEEDPAGVDRVDSFELGLGVREPPLGDGAEDEQRAQLKHVIRGPQPLHHRQGGAGVLVGGRGVAEVHRQVGEAGVEQRRRPRALVAADQRQRAHGRLDRPRRVADVLARVGEHLARGRGDVGVGIGRQPLEPGRERGRIRAVVREQHRDHPGQPRVAVARPELRQQLADRRAAPVVRDHHTHHRHHQRGARGVLELRRRVPVAKRVGDRARHADQAAMLAADRPEEPEHGEQLDERGTVAVGERVAQLVGEVDLLDGDRVDRRELVAVGEAGAVAVRVRGRPGPPGRARLAGLAGALELQAAELADGLEHPVADAARRAADAQQRLVDEPLDRVQRAVAEQRVRGLEREAVVEEREPAQRAPLGLADQVPGPVDHGEQRLVAVGRATVAAAQQREAVLEPPVDLLDRHRADLRRGQLDRQRQAVEPGHDAAHEILRQLGARARREGAVAEQRGRVVRPQLAEQVDVLRGDLERRAARREHAQVGGRGDEEGHQLGHRFDDVLAVVEHDEARALRQPLRDAAAEVGALLGRQRALRADRVAHVEHGAHLADDVLGRGDADELDDVHHRLDGVAREDVGQPRLAETARPDDRHHARVGQQRAEPGDVAVAAAQRARVVADAAADGAVEREQVAMGPGEALAGVGADPVEQVLPVGLVALERRARARARRPRCAAGRRAAPRRRGARRARPPARPAPRRARRCGWTPAPGSRGRSRDRRPPRGGPRSAGRSSSSPGARSPSSSPRASRASVAARSASSSSAATASCTSAASRTLSTSAGSTPSR